MTQVASRAPNRDIGASLRRTFANRVRALDSRLSGIMSFTQSEVILEAMGAAGIDYVIIDTEHSPVGMETVARLIRAADAVQLPALVRFPHVDSHRIQLALNAGAAGIVISLLEEVVEAEQLVAATRYQPNGKRGTCPFARSTRFAMQNWSGVAADHEAAVVTVAIIETVRGLENMDEIAAVDGLDVLFLGPGDMSLSMGIPFAGLLHPALSAALDHAVSACAANSIRVMTNIPLDDAMTKWAHQRGVDMLCYASDNTIFFEACNEIARQTVDSSQGGAGAGE